MMPIFCGCGGELSDGEGIKERREDILEYLYLGGMPCGDDENADPNTGRGGLQRECWSLSGLWRLRGYLDELGGRAGGQGCRYVDALQMICQIQRCAVVLE